MPMEVSCQFFKLVSKFLAIPKCGQISRASKPIERMKSSKVFSGSLGIGCFPVQSSDLRRAERKLWAAAWGASAAGCTESSVLLYCELCVRSSQHVLRRTANKTVSVRRKDMKGLLH